VTVTGIQRDQNDATAEFDYEWQLEAGPANLASAVKDRFQFADFTLSASTYGMLGSAGFVVFETLGRVSFKGKGRATLKLYDDGWRVTVVRS